MSMCGSCYNKADGDIYGSTFTMELRTNFGVESPYGKEKMFHIGDC